MNVKVYEGEELEALIERAKEELGDVEILYYEVEKKRSFIPFFGKKRYRLFVMPKPKVEEGDREDKDREELVEIKKEIEELKGLLASVTSSAAPPQPLPEHLDKDQVFADKRIFLEFSGDAVELIQLLVKKGVNPEIAEEIVRDSCGLDIETEKLDLNTATFREAVLKGVEGRIKFTGEFKVEEGGKRVFAFIGPTGVGKTTNLFKIASKFVIEQELRVGVITTDTFKVGAVQQARTYASILNIPFFVVTDSKKLKETLSGLENLDVVLIDTVGRSHYDYWRLGEIKATLSGASIPMDLILLISCNYDTSEAVEVVNRYRSFFSISSLFFTKVDETSKPGIMVNLPVITGLPVSYVSTGQRVPEDIKLLTPEIVTDYLVGA
ncbi:MAG: flagellar biosynthesis protein FlhF [Desulfurobacteriaceae bacterium]